MWPAPLSILHNLQTLEIIAGDPSFETNRTRVGLMFSFSCLELLCLYKKSLGNLVKRLTSIRVLFPATKAGREVTRHSHESKMIRLHIRVLGPEVHVQLFQPVIICESQGVVATCLCFGGLLFIMGFGRFVRSLFESVASKRDISM